MFIVSGEHSRGSKLHTDNVPSPSVVRNSALSGFRLRFTNGGHQIRQIGVLVEGSAVRIAFEDSDGNDPIRYLARYETFDEADIVSRDVLEGNTGTSIGRIARGPRLASNYVELLQGFRMEFADGDDHEISRISLNTYNFIGEDVRETDIAFNDLSGSGAFEYQVQLLTVRRSALGELSGMSGGPSTSDLTSADMPPELVNGPNVIMGFELMYAKDPVTDGRRGWSADSHYVERLDVDLAPLDFGASSATVGMDDGDRDDLTWKEVRMAGR